MIEVGEEGGHASVNVMAEVGELARDVAVGVPVPCPAGIELDETDPAFNEASSHETELAEGAGAGFLETVKVTGGGAFGGEVGDAEGFELHARGEFVVGDAGFEILVEGVAGFLLAVELVNDREQALLLVRRHAVRALDVVDGGLGIGTHSGAGEDRRQPGGGVGARADAGAFTIYAGTQPVHAAEVLGLIYEQLDLLLKDGITDDELDIAKGYLTGAFELGLEDTGSRMSRTAGQLITVGKVRPVAEQVAKWEAVQQADTRRVIERILNQPLTVVALGPIDASDLPRR